MSESEAPETKSKMERGRSRRISTEQREAMLTYLKAHPKLMKGKGKAMETFEQKTDSWHELSKILNGIQTGPRKTAERWLKSFQDWKSDVKGKQQRARTRPGVTSLTDYERDLLQMLQDGGELDSEDPLNPSFNSLELEPLDLKPQLSESETPPSSPEPKYRESKRRKRDKPHDDADDREERAIRAMENQATSLNRMASAIERISEATVQALERFTHSNNNRQF